MTDDELLLAEGFILPVDEDSANEFLGEIRDVADQARKERLEKSRRNELWVLGEQRRDLDGTTLQNVWDQTFPYLPHNHLRGMVNGQVARLTQARPSVTAYPTHEEARDRAAAKVASSFIEYQERKIGFDNLLSKVVRYGLIHGTAGFKIVYDTASNSIVWDPISIFEFWIDPAANSFEDAKWVIFCNYIDRYEAISELRSAGKDASGVGEVSYKRTVDGDEVSGVECLELWHLPTARVPRGLYLKTIGGVVADIRDYPYMLPIRESMSPMDVKPVLPLVLFTWDDHRGRVYGDTALDDAVPIQRQINEDEAVAQRLKRATGSVKLVAPEQIVNQLRQSNNQYISYAAANGNKDIYWLPPPQLPQLVLSDRELQFQRLYDVFGMNEVLAGVQSPKSGTSARQIAYLNELDSMKLAPAAKSMERMIECGWRLTFSLAQLYMSEEQMLRISGKDTLEVLAFRGADLAGVDVLVEPRAGLERTAAQKAAQVQEEHRAGLASPEEAREALETGLREPAFVSVNKRMLGSEIRGVLQGAAPSFEVEPSIAVKELTKIIDLLREEGSNPNNLFVLEELLAGYRQALANERKQSEK